MILGSTAKSDIKKGAGFQVSQTQIEEKKNKKIKNKKKVIVKGEEECTKRSIMEKMGIENQDVDEYFDILNDRVFDKKQPDEINDKLQEKVQTKL